MMFNASLECFSYVFRLHLHCLCKKIVCKLRYNINAFNRQKQCY